MQQRLQGVNENAIVTNSRAIESGDLAADLPLMSELTH